ncbi:hypothetical protein OPV22_019971 [Ensete ventricosum]|uniref:Uncharacterized protein n=1 Tax=Ensete ventricosum TaxID=4639 RepID=A0AAV8QNQ6_ENSVE|nr:hypothetical protein OPV22_019971 [Ensete ventricosum]
MLNAPRSPQALLRSYVGTFGVDLSDEESDRRLRSRRSLRSSRKREFSFELDLIVGREEDSCHGMAVSELMDVRHSANEEFMLISLFNRQR